MLQLADNSLARLTGSNKKVFVLDKTNSVIEHVHAQSLGRQFSQWFTAKQDVTLVSAFQQALQQRFAFQRIATDMTFMEAGDVAGSVLGEAVRTAAAGDAGIPWYFDFLLPIKTPSTTDATPIKTFS